MRDAITTLCKSGLVTQQLQMGIPVGVCQGDLGTIRQLLTRGDRDVARIPLGNWQIVGYAAMITCLSRSAINRTAAIGALVVIEFFFVLKFFFLH